MENKKANLEILLSSSKCKKCSCNKKELPKFGDDLVSDDVSGNLYSFEYYSRIILEYMNDKRIEGVLDEKVKEPVDQGIVLYFHQNLFFFYSGCLLFVRKKNDNIKGSNSSNPWVWGRSNDRNDCKKLYFDWGIVSVNAVKIKPELKEQYTFGKRIRYCTKRTDGGQDIVVIHYIKEHKACRCYCHKEIPFETRKRRDTRKRNHSSEEDSPKNCNDESAESDTSVSNEAPQNKKARPDETLFGLAEIALASLAQQ